MAIKRKKMFDSLSDLDKKQEIHICTLNEGCKKSIDVRYVFYPDNQRSHRISFKKRNRTLFELFVGNDNSWLNEFSHIGSDILGLYQIPMSEDDIKVKPGFILSVLLFILGRRAIYFSEHFAEYNVEATSASLERKYFLALCSGWTGPKVLLLQNRISKGSSTYKKSQSYEYDWIKISKSDFEKLVKSIADLSNTAKLPKVS